MFSILVCEDDRNIRKLMCEYLRADKHNVFEAKNGLAALDILDNTHIDLMISDVMMPKMDGYALARALRDAKYELPILMITAKESIDNKKDGFNNGADDYMVKPIDMEEMLLRVYALLRRAKVASEKKLAIGESVFDYENFTVAIKGAVSAMPKKEFMLIFRLLSSLNKIFTRQELMDEIWGYDTESDEQTINVHIRRIRERFSNSTDFEIVTVKGLGYKAIKSQVEAKP